MPAADRPALHAAWPAPAGVHALTTLRHGAGVSPAPWDSLNLGGHRSASGDDPANVLRNRAALVDLFGLPSPPRWLRQVHGTAVARFALHDADPSFEPEADAAVTTDAGVVLAVLTADCLPVVFAARDTGALGAAHAGWKGLAGGVLEATVAAMAGDPACIVAWLGPAAGSAAYEIGTEVRDAFLGRDPGCDGAFVATRPGHWRVDLYAIARRRLASVGVTDVHGGDRCTISDPGAFFSHRRDQVTGRIATLAWRDRRDWSE